VPIYEYQCRVCHKKFESLILGKREKESILCPDCGAKYPKKLISRVVYQVSERDRLAAFNPLTSKDKSFYNDARNIGLHAKKRAQQMGVDLGEGFEKSLERLRTDPGRVLKDGE